VSPVFFLHSIKRVSHLALVTTVILFVSSIKSYMTKINYIPTLTTARVGNHIHLGATV